MRWSILAIGCSGLICAPAATARDRHGAKADSAVTTALFPIISSRGIDAALIQEVESRLELAIEAANLHVLSGAALNAKLGQKTQADLDKCAADLTCVAKLGHRLKVNEVIVGRAGERPGGGTKISIIVVNVDSAQIDRKSTLEIGATPDVPTELARGFHEIFQEEFPTSLVTASAAEPLSAGKAPPKGLELVGITPTSDVLELEPVPVVPPPASGPAAAGPPLIIAKPVTAGTEPKGEAQRPLDSARSAAPLPTPVRAQALSWRIYAGGAALALGAIGVGVGSYWGAQSRSLYSEANNPQTSMKRAVEVLKPQADSDVNKANLFFGLGGTVLAAGVALLAWEFLGKPAPRTPVASLDVSERGIRAVLAFAY
jgi:hypothetical protein